MAAFGCPGAKIYYYPGNAIMTLNPSGEANTPPTQWGQVLGIAVGLTALLTVMLAAFALPPCTRARTTFRSPWQGPHRRLRN